MKPNLFEIKHFIEKILKKVLSSYHVGYEKFSRLNLGPSYSMYEANMAELQRICLFHEVYSKNEAFGETGVHFQKCFEFMNF